MKVLLPLSNWEKVYSPKRNIESKVVNTAGQQQPSAHMGIMENICLVLFQRQDLCHNSPYTTIPDPAYPFDQLQLKYRGIHLREHVNIQTTKYLSISEM